MKILLLASCLLAAAASRAHYQTFNSVDDYFSWGSSSRNDLSATCGGQPFSLFAFAPQAEVSFALSFWGEEFWVSRDGSTFEGPFRLSVSTSKREFYVVPAEAYFFAHRDQCLESSPRLSLGSSGARDDVWNIEQAFGQLSHYRLIYEPNEGEIRYAFWSQRGGIDTFNVPPEQGVVPLIELLSRAIEGEQCLPLELY